MGLKSSGTRLTTPWVLSSVLRLFENSLTHTTILAVMAPQNVDQLVGRALDAAVARHVFG
jgi:hypothetical protein